MAAAKSAPGLEIDLVVSIRSAGVPSKRQFQTWARAALPLRCGACAVSIVVVGAQRSRTLNRQYRGFDKATNVLSFAGPGRGADGVDRLGELIICAAVVAREARRQGKSAVAHWAHLAVHGVLHLRGFDHQGAREAAKMEKIEVQVLEKMGFSDPYA